MGKGAGLAWYVLLIKDIAPSILVPEKTALPTSGVRSATVSALKVLRPHIEGREVTWFSDELPAYEFQASADVKIPIKIFGAIKDQTGLSLMVFCYWKKALTSKQIRVLASLVKYYTKQYPEFENCALEIVDLSEGSARGPRTLKVHTWATIKLLTDGELNDIMKFMSDAYLWALNDIIVNPAPEKPKKPRKPKEGDTIDLFP